MYQVASLFIEIDRKNSITVARGLINSLILRAGGGLLQEMVGVAL